MFGPMSYTKDLIEGGFTKEQADVSIKVWLELMENKFATKQDIQFSELALRSDMKEMESSIRSDMKEMENSLRSDINRLDNKIDKVKDELTIKLTRNMVVIAGFVVALQKIF